MEIKTLNGIDNKDILDVFNNSFSDYIVPFHLSEEQLTLKMLAEKVKLDFSVGVFESERLVAFILHGYDQIGNEKIIYNAGTGVIPDKRGIGLTTQMYHFILPLLKEQGINKAFLEVISSNIPAIKSYEKSGYERLRELLCYKGDLNISTISNNIEIKELKDYDWKLMELFWDISPTWQNSKNVVDELRKENVSLGAYIQNQLVGYLIYNPNNKRLQQIATNRDFRKRKIASSLLSKLIEENGNSISIVNVDKGSKPVNAFLEKIGLEKTVEQLEMKLQLTNNQG